MIKVLLVEDNQLFRLVVQDVLSNLDDIQFVGVAENGNQAIELLQDGLDPDIVLTDLDMPVMNGFELLCKIIDSNIKIPVLVMSMRSSENYYKRVMEAGAHGYVSKEDIFELDEHIRTVSQGRIAVSTGMQRYHTPRT